MLWVRISPRLPLDQLAVTVFAGSQSDFGCALVGDIDTAHDHKAGLRSGGLVRAVAVQAMRRGSPERGCQLISKDWLAAPARTCSKWMEHHLALPCGEQFLREGASGEIGEAVTGGQFAGAIEAHDATRGIEDQNEGAHGVEHGANEISLGGKRLLGALAGTLHIFLQVAGGVKLQASRHLAGEDLQVFDIHAAESVCLLRADGNRRRGSRRKREMTGAPA